MKKFARRRSKKGQSTIEYLLMVVFGALLGIQLTRFFNGVFRDGLTELETEVQKEMATGQGFGNGSQ